MTRRFDSNRLGTIADVLITAIVFTTSLGMGTGALRELAVNTISYTLPVAAMSACGQGLTSPGSVSSDFAAFAKRERPSITCDAVIGASAPIPPDPFSMTYRYAIYSVAAAMRIGGLSWTTLDRYVATLFAVSMALTYLLFRMVVGRLLSIAGVGALIFSNHILAIGLDLRDYGKQIWFAMLWLAMAWLLARGLPRVSRSIYLPSAVAGVILGVGIGFRGDLLIFLPAFLAVILFALRLWNRRAIATKAIAMATFLATFVVAGGPMLTTLGSGSNFAHFAVLGLSKSFTQGMGVDPPAYNLGDFYADGFAHSLVAAHAIADHDHEVGTLNTKLYDRQGTALVMAAVRHFPADFIVRGFGATRQILAYPFDPIVEWDVGHFSMLNRGDVLTHLMARRIRIGRWLNGWEWLLAAIAFIAVAVRDLRSAVIGTTLILYFCGYSLIQFQRRHTFHLDVVAVLIVLIVASATVSVIVWLARELTDGRPARDLVRHAVRRLLPAVATGLILMLAVSACTWLARVWQQRHVTALLDQTLDSQWSPITTTREPLAPFLEQRHDPLTQWFESQLRGNDPWHSPAWWSSALLLRAEPATREQAASDDRDTFRASYVRVEMGGAGCAVGRVPIVALYSSSIPSTDHDFTQVFYADVRGNPRRARLLMPIIESPGTSRFEGFALPADRVDCVQHVLRASRPSEIPLPILFAVLSDDWRSMPLFQRLATHISPVTQWTVTGLLMK